MTESNFSWRHMTEEQRKDAEINGKWTSGKCKKCYWYDETSKCCGFFLFTGHIRRKPESYGGACPEYKPRKKDSFRRTRPYGEKEGTEADR